MIYDVPYWWWDGILPPTLCETIILEGDKLVPGDGRTGGGGDGGTYNPDIRETNISFFDSGHWIDGLCLHYANLANRSAGWNVEINGIQNVQYARYFPDQHYAPHRDDTIRRNETNTMRKLSVAIQLSDPSTYEGGDFIMEMRSGEFMRLSDFKKQGSVMVFPSIIKHGVEPVTRGVRHSAVCWLTGPNFR